MKNKPNSGMYRNLTSYGDDEFSVFLRKAFIKAMGYTDDALERPIIGITNTYSGYNACHRNVPDLVDAVKRGVMLAGGLPIDFPTISIHESFAHPTSMFLRNLMSMDAEEMIRAQPMDAVVLIGGCDKTVPALLMGAASTNIPAILEVTGPMATGDHRGERVGACTDCRRFWSAHRAGEISADEIADVGSELAPSAGTCMVMGTASTMACVSEALGVMLPNGAAISAVASRRLRHAEETGARAVSLATNEQPMTLSKFLTAEAFENALRVLMAIGGSTNGLIHLAAIAGRVGLEIDLDLVDKIGSETPVLLDLKPSGDHYMSDFHQAGGVIQLMREIAGDLHLEVPTIGGPTLGEILDTSPPSWPQNVIRSTTNPIYDGGAIAVLKGNLAPGGAVIKQSAASPELLTHTGRAFVFSSVEDLAARIDDPSQAIHPSDILVLQNAGPKGAPGMPEAGALPIPKYLSSQGVRDMVRISDARMSGTAYGTVVLHVTPEAAEGGPLRLVKTGDEIALNVPERRLDLLVAGDELTIRQGAHARPRPAPKRGFGKLHQDHVLQADEGCDFDFLVGEKA